MKKKFNFILGICETADMKVTYIGGTVPMEPDYVKFIESNPEAQVTLEYTFDYSTPEATEYCNSRLKELTSFVNGFPNIEIVEA